jgi:nucleoside-diphosphate-sugar epimerase
MGGLRVFVTGTTGRVGRVLVPAFREHYDLKTLHRRPAPDDPTAVLGDLSDQDHLTSMMAGCDVVLHLAAVSDEAASVEEIAQANIVGAYNVLQAAQEAGVRRAVFASSCHAFQFRRSQQVIEADEPYRPENVYGASKVFGEALGRYYHELFGMEFIAIRVGYLLPYDDPGLRTSAFRRGIWLSPRDAVALFRLAIERPGIGYAAVFATSKTAREVVSLRAASEMLGYQPQDSVVGLYGPECEA